MIRMPLYNDSLAKGFIEFSILIHIANVKAEFKLGVVSLRNGGILAGIIQMRFRSREH